MAQPLTDEEEYTIPDILSFELQHTHVPCLSPITELHTTVHTTGPGDLAIKSMANDAQIPLLNMTPPPVVSLQKPPGGAGANTTPSGPCGQGVSPSVPLPVSWANVMTNMQQSLEILPLLFPHQLC